MTEATPGTTTRSPLRGPPVPHRPRIEEGNTGHNHPVTVEGGRTRWAGRSSTPSNTGHNHPVTVEGSPLRKWKCLMSFRDTGHNHPVTVEGAGRRR